MHQGTAYQGTEHQGALYYVDAVSGNNSWAGSAEEPFQTIRRAAGVVKPGDTVIVREGVYEEIVELTTSGTNDAWITFKVNPGDKVLVTVSADEWGGYGRPFDIRANYIHIEGFEVTSKGPGGKGIWINGTKQKPLHHIRVFNNVARDCGGSGIGSMYADYLHIKGNTVYRNAFWSHWQESGINLCDGKAFDNKKGYHNIVENNISFDNYNKVPAMLLDSKGRITFQSDETSDGNGIIIDWCRDRRSSTLIQNNICFNNGGRGIQVTASVNVTVINNTMYMNSRDQYSIGDFGNHAAGPGSTGAANIILQNNIIYARAGKPALTIWDKPGCVYDYNLYFGEAHLLFNGNVQDNDRNPQNHGSHNILNQDPLFARIAFTAAEDGISDISAYDFSPQKSSPGINAGNAALTAETDIWGNKRTGAGMGAVVFVD